MTEVKAKLYAKKEFQIEHELKRSKIRLSGLRSRLAANENAEAKQRKAYREIAAKVSGEKQGNDVLSGKGAKHRGQILIQSLKSIVSVKGHEQLLALEIEQASKSATTLKHKALGLKRKQESFLAKRAAVLEHLGTEEAGLRLKRPFKTKDQEALATVQLESDSETRAILGFNGLSQIKDNQLNLTNDQAEVRGVEQINFVAQPELSSDSAWAKACSNNNLNQPSFAHPGLSDFMRKVRELMSWKGSQGMALELCYEGVPGKIVRLSVEKDHKRKLRIRLFASSNSDRLALWKSKQQISEALEEAGYQVGNMQIEMRR